MMKSAGAKILGLTTALLLVGGSCLAQSPNASSPPINEQFKEQAFSQTLMEEIPVTCADNGLEVACSFSHRYLFQDTELIYEQDSTRSRTHTLVFTQPLSRSQAFSYAHALPNADLLFHVIPDIETDKVTYHGCIDYIGGSASAFSDYDQGCQVEFNLDSTGQVLSIRAVSYSG